MISFRPLAFTFCIMEFSRFSHDLRVKNPRLFRMKIIFNIYCVLSVDQANTCSDVSFIHFKLLVVSVKVLTK